MKQSFCPHEAYIILRRENKVYTCVSLISICIRISGNPVKNTDFDFIRCNGEGGLRIHISNNLPVGISVTGPWITL